MAGARTAAARSVGWFGASNLLATLGGYVVTIVLTRGLGAGDFGAVAALLAVGLVGTIPASAVQLAIASRVAVAPNGATGAVSDVLRPVITVSAVLVVSGLAASPVLTWYLHLDSPVPVLLVVATLPGVVLTSACQGVLLGRSQIGRLATSTAIAAASRLVCVTSALVVVDDVSGVMAAMLAASVLTALVSARLVGTGSGPHLGWSRSWQDVAHGTLALTGLFLLTNVDVPVARHLLDPAGSGLYALGSVFAKACFWGPQFIAVLAYPRMVRADRPRRNLVVILAVTAALGGLASIALWLVGGPLAATLSGEQYAQIGPLAGAFGVLGTLWSLINVAVLSGIAGARRVISVAVWVGVLVQIVALQALGARATPDLVLAVALGTAVAVGAATIGAGIARPSGEPVVGINGAAEGAVPALPVTTSAGRPSRPGGSDGRRSVGRWR